jgi:hypothetical protein
MKIALLNANKRPRRRRDPATTGTLDKSARISFDRPINTYNPTCMEEIMRKFLIGITAAIVSLALLTPALAGGKVTKKSKDKWYVTVDALPGTLDECKALRNELATSAQGGLVYYFVTQLVITTKPKIGEQCLVLGMDKSELVETIDLRPKFRRTNVKGWQLGSSEVKKMKTSGFVTDAPYAANTYVMGTDVANGYKLPELPYKYYVRAHRIQKKGGLSGEWENTWHGFVNESGSASGAKPFFVKKNAKGVWKMYKSSSFYAGTKDPPKQVEDDL